ncbi:hypothetical protein BHYA_0045g00150 [Botrytis hyacinthi]|uniref:Uncharacterized protein n=1 Tax=Botrytis hyacinthi TaxID=278943 RepID=A0A4Z1GXQ1_9HELO|nr:hypothetical protein BHYA_0045g00150 [Botrytis hyacinthi]
MGCNGGLKTHLCVAELEIGRVEGYMPIPPNKPSDSMLKCIAGTTSTIYQLLKKLIRERHSELNRRIRAATNGNAHTRVLIQSSKSLKPKSQKRKYQFKNTEQMNDNVLLLETVQKSRMEITIKVWKS